jgi:hypothetical protein
MQHPHEPVNRALFTPVVDNRIRVGDIVVTAVADHYVIGRVTRDGNRAQDVLAWETTCPGSVETALNIAGEDHRPDQRHHRPLRGIRRPHHVRATLPRAGKAGPVMPQTIRDAIIAFLMAGAMLVLSCG